MHRRGVTRSILHGFLSTYASRYSSWNGYWLWGFVVGEGVRHEWDLLDRTVHGSDDPIGYARRLAIKKFAEQCAKVKADDWFDSVLLTISVEGPLKTRVVRLLGRPGFHMRLVVRAHAAFGVVELERIIMVSRHDPKLESQSLREDDS